MGVYLCECMCATCMSGACRGQKRASDPLEVDLQAAVCHHVGAEKQNQLLSKSSRCS